MNLNIFVIGLFCLMMTIAYVIDCDLATKQQWHGDIAVDSDVFLFPEQLSPTI
jgi:hypothetical protein